MSVHSSPTSNSTDHHTGFEVSFHRELAILAPPNDPPQMRSPTGSWLAAATSRSQVASPTPDDQQVNGNRVTSPTPDDRPARHDKKRMSLAFLTKGVITGESQTYKENGKEDITAPPQPADDVESTTTSTHSRSRSKDTNRTRLSLSFLRPSSPLEALPDFASSENVSGITRVTSQRSRPETSKSEKSSDGTARKGSVKKRLSFMSISKKGSKNSVAGRGRANEVLVEE